MRLALLILRPLIFRLRGFEIAVAGNQDSEHYVIST